MRTKALRRNFLLLVLGFAALCAAPTLQASFPTFSGIATEADTAESVFAEPTEMPRLPGTGMTVQGMVTASFPVNERVEYRAGAR